MKMRLIVIGVILAIILLVIGIIASKNNTAVVLEEQIFESKSAINIQEKRREDLIYNLVDTVKSYAKYEQETLTKIAQARGAGNIEEAKMLVLAVAEQYPELKANDQYTNLMIELTSTENTIANYRNSYNAQVKRYNKYIRKFPNNLILGMLGYDALEENYLSYNASEDAPRNLFVEE